MDYRSIAQSIVSVAFLAGLIWTDTKISRPSRSWLGFGLDPQSDHFPKDPPKPIRTRDPQSLMVLPVGSPNP